MPATKRPKAAKKVPRVKFTKAQMAVIADMFGQFMREVIRPRVEASIREELKGLRVTDARLDALEEAFRSSGGSLKRPAVDFSRMFT